MCFFIQRDWSPTQTAQWVFTNEHRCMAWFGCEMTLTGTCVGTLMCGTVLETGFSWKKWVSLMIDLEARTLAPFRFCLCFLINPGVSKQLLPPAPTATSYSCHYVFLHMMVVASNHEPKQSFLLLSQVFGFKDKTDNKCTFTIQPLCSIIRSCWMWNPHGLSQTTPS